MPQSLLSADQILAALDLSECTEKVPEWPDADGNPGLIRLQQMTAEENLELTETLRDPDLGGHEGSNGMFLMLVFCAKDADGKRLFTMEQVAALRQKNFNVLDRLQQVAMRLNKIGAFREDLKKASGEAATDGSPTD